jgi:RNA polymerase sigma-70 factor (ECF subfamily)
MDMTNQPSPVDRTLSTRPDAELIGQIIDGSHDALAELYDRYGGTVHAVAMRTGRDPGIAADVVQETFLTMWDRAGQFDPSRGALGAWLATIARNRTVDHLRAATRQARVATFSSFGRDDDHPVADWLPATAAPVSMAVQEPGPESVLAAAETRESIKGALASLAPLERSVILLAYAEGLSQSEISTRLGWPMGTVKTRTRRALRHLREWLDREPVGPVSPVSPCRPSPCPG